jgi:hypothetical protein
MDAANRYTLLEGRGASATMPRAQKLGWKYERPIYSDG